MTRGWNEFAPASLWCRHLFDALPQPEVWRKRERGMLGVGGFTEMENRLRVMTIEIFLGGAERGDEWRQTFTLEACW